MIKQEKYQKNNNKEIDCSFSSKKLKICGFDKIILFEFIKTVLDIYVNCLSIFSEDALKKELINEQIKLLLNTNIFNLIIQCYFQFKINNFFMLDLVKIIFDNDKASEELVLKILQLDNLNQEINDNNFIFINK